MSYSLESSSVVVLQWIATLTLPAHLPPHQRQHRAQDVFPVAVHALA
jgi:hypothetical protein